MDNEQWVPIKGYEGYYEISSYGRVKSLARRNRNIDMILVPVKYGKGNRYRAISLSVMGKIKKCYIHRLVATAFIPNPRMYREVNHLDGVPTNNNVNNLEWCDKRHNHLHAYAMGLQKPMVGEDVSTHVFTEREVLFLRYIKGLYPSIKNKDVAKFYGVAFVSVEKIWKGTSWKHI